MNWNGSIDWADKFLPDLVIYGFSILGFAWLPSRLGRKVWWLVGWFVLVNCVFLLGFWEGVDWGNPYIFAALGQLPWILFILDLVFQGRLSGFASSIPVREILLWQVTRLMGLHYLLSIQGGLAPKEFAVEAGFSEIVTALGALALWLVNQPQRGWYRTAVIFWNTYGLTSALATDYRIFLSNPQLPFSRYSREIFHYMTAYPQNWVYCFWLQLAICLHAIIFYKVLLARTARTA